MTNIEMHENLMSTILMGLNKDLYTEEEIYEASIKARLISNATDEECKKAIMNIQAMCNVSMDLGVLIKDNSQEPWYPSRKADIEPFYWKRYKKYLKFTKKFPGSVINSIDKSTNEIMDLLGDPIRNSYFNRKGLVLGDVQSGKTATYTAICNKAADVGYRVIILLTGTIESLRRQTQSRIDEGFVGMKSSKSLSKMVQEKIMVGVGKFDPSRSAAVFTSEVRDFNATLLNSLGMKLKNYIEPSIFVIKKNKRTLENLHEWLRTYNADPSIDYKIDLPLLMIDDEADNASVNTKYQDNPTTINKCIRNLLALFTKSTYLGVTATPYANIFINPDAEHNLHKQDLFPENFIYALSPPSNYIGNVAIFGNEEEYLSSVEKIYDITDNVDEFLRFHQKKNYYLRLDNLPQSLENAIYYFILTNGIFDIRGFNNRHRSMLINVSRLKIVQSHIRMLVENFLNNVISDIDNYSKLPENKACNVSEHLKNLRSIWFEYNLEILSKITWEEFQYNNLRKAAIPIELREVNSNAHAKRLNYDDYKSSGARFIAIGGNSLSRGLTLEGLCVSYFYRNSKMYDTLLQMGRWFGYRDGYDDLFKIWMTTEAIDWFQYITEATSELKEEIFRMNTYGMTPGEFGLRIRQDISSLIVTARNKMRHTNSIERVYSIAGRLIETPRLPSNKGELEENFILTECLYKKLCMHYKQSPTHKNAVYFRNIDSTHIYEYLNNFILEPHNLAFNIDAFIRYSKRSRHFSKWDIAFPYTKSGKQASLDIPINMQRRNFTIKNNMLLVNGTKLRVGSGGCTQIGLDKHEIITIDRYFKSRSTRKNVPDNEYLTEGRNPLLIVHVLDMSSNSKNLGYNDLPLIALGVGFPKVKNALSSSATVKYVVNLVAVRNGVIEAIDEGDDYYDK